MLDFLNRNLSNGMTLMVITLLVLAIAYRYYSAFLAARVLALDSNRATPAHTLGDGHNYYPTNKWVLFGHHFAAISGAGPLIGPVLAAQFGYLPGFLWILAGVCLAGAVQDFTILVFSMRRNGQSLARIAYQDIGPVAGTAATIGILFVLVIALAGLGKVVTKALGGDVVNYPEHTQFIAPEGGAFLSSFGTPMVYRIPAETRIVYPTGTIETVATRFEIEAGALDPDAATDIDAHEAGKLVGSKLIVPAGYKVVRKISGSAWGTFTIALTIPIALFVGWYIYRFRKGRVVEASVLGGVFTLGAVYLGGLLDSGVMSNGAAAPDASWIAAFLAGNREWFNLSEFHVGIAMAIYGFIASVLPVWLLLCPRDYLSSFLKIGTVILLVVGVIIAHPHLHAPAINMTFLQGGPAFKGALFPFVFIVIMCGAISGFHALVSSGTTPKMINNERDARTIGFGAMLIEGLVAIIALIAACALPSSHYYHIQTSMENLPAYQQQIAELALKDDVKESPGKMSELVGENVQGRTGGAVTLAVGMARIFDEAARNILNLAASKLEVLTDMMKYWYHFAIMFEALFILTTIDTGTRVGRFLLQETMGKCIHPKLGKTDWWPSAFLATGLMVFGWWYFLASNSVEVIWPMFGIANQMLAVMALAVGTVCLVQMGKARYIWVTLVPMSFVIITTTSAAFIMLRSYLTLMTTAGTPGGKWTSSLLSTICIVVIVACTVCVVVAALLKARRLPRAGGISGNLPAVSVHAG